MKKKALKLRKISSTFQSTDGKSRSFSYAFNKKLFKLDPSECNLDLARLSLAMAMASYNGEGDYSKRDTHIKRFFKKLGFKKIYSNESYRSQPTAHSIGVCFGIKKYFTFTLIAIAVRSGGYEREWASNFTFGEEGHHEGFSEAASIVMEELEKYLRDLNLFNKKKLRFWVSGYSRGGATANLVAAELIHQFDREHTPYVLRSQKPLNFHPSLDAKIYAYTFESPAPAIIKEEHRCFDIIYNFASEADLVTYVPFAFMGFTRFGKVIPLSFAIENVDDINTLLPEYKYHPFGLKTLSGIKVVDVVSTCTKKEFIQELLGFFEKGIGLTREEYVDRYQVALGNLTAFLKSNDPALIKEIFSKFSLIRVITSLFTPRSFNHYIHKIVDPYNLDIKKEDLDVTIDGCYALITKMIYVDKDHGFIHLLTLAQGGASLFDEHSIEIIYRYLATAKEEELCL